MKLRLQVPSDRESAAFATLTDGRQTIAQDHAAASASVLIAKKHGNAACDPLRTGGHPPLGTYRLLQAQPLDVSRRDEYGTHALVFEPMSGPALEAESFGRLGLLVYGGRPGENGRLRRTQGGVRLTNRLLDRLVASLKSPADLTLELVAVKQPSWWAFWRRPVTTQPLSSEPPRDVSPPVDELTLLNTLLASAPRRPRPSRDTSSGRDDDRSTRESSSSSSRGSGENFRGGGGDFGGAGASGRWDAAPAASGVDRTGMIVAGAAAAAAAAGIAAAQSTPADDTGSSTDTRTSY